MRAIAYRSSLAMHCNLMSEEDQCRIGMCMGLESMADGRCVSGRTRANVET